MSKSFSEWIKERRKEITLPSGIKVVIRPPQTWKAAEMGPLPNLEDESDVKKNIAVYRRYVEVCLVSIGEENDPIGRGLCSAEDFSFDDGNAIMEEAISLLPKREEREDGVPLADTASPQDKQDS